jgi:hypothetical protein
MSKKRLRLRLAVMALMALLLGPLAAPSMASAHQVSCGQNSECGCCIVICCGGGDDCDAREDSEEEFDDEDELDEQQDAADEQEDQADEQQDAAEENESDDESDNTDDSDQPADQDELVDDVPTGNPADLLRLSELLPNPVGADREGEFIELVNLGAAPAEMSGWLIRVGSDGKEFALPIGELAGGGRLALPYSETKITLTNGGMVLELVGPDGLTKDVATYEDEAEEGVAYAKSGDGWFWTTTPTPGFSNVITAEEQETPPSEEPNDPAPAEESEPTEETEAEPAPAEEDAPTDEGDAEEMPILTVEQIHDLPDGELMRVTGVVTMPLGVVGTTIFGIRDADAEYGATVRIYSSDRPNLQVGDIVVVDGKVTHKESGELRINTSGSHPVQIVGSTELGVAPEVRLEDLDGTGSGLAVTVNGQVADTGTNWFVLTDEQAERELKVELPTGSLLPVESGDQVTVSGIVRVQRSVVALAVLDDSDVAPEQIPDESEAVESPAESADSTEPTQTDTEESSNATATLPFLVVGALGAGGVAYRGLRPKK